MLLGREISKRPWQAENLLVFVVVVVPFEQEQYVLGQYSGQFASHQASVVTELRALHVVLEVGVEVELAEGEGVGNGVNPQAQRSAGQTGLLKLQVAEHHASVAIGE